jgi:surfactin synthase thioesterase subunit
MIDTARGTVFFPGAGSFGREVQPLIDALKPAAWLVRYPGRHGKGFGVPAESFDAVVRACAEQVTRRAPANPILFGHSFGAYVAYASAIRLAAAGIEVSALVTVGASAPGRLAVSERATETAAGAAAYLDSVDPGALADAPSDEWREIVIETTMQDLRHLRQFPQTSSTGIECPIFAVRGDADPLTSDDSIDEWQRHTNGDFSRHVFPGNHSDFLRSPRCIAWIREIRDSFGERPSMSGRV